MTVQGKRLKNRYLALTILLSIGLSTSCLGRSKTPILFPTDFQGKRSAENFNVVQENDQEVKFVTLPTRFAIDCTWNNISSSI